MAGSYMPATSLAGRYLDPQSPTAYIYIIRPTMYMYNMATSLEAIRGQIENQRERAYTGLHQNATRNDEWIASNTIPSSAIYGARAYALHNFPIGTSPTPPVIRNYNYEDVPPLVNNAPYNSPSTSGAIARFLSVLAGVGGMIGACWMIRRFDAQCASYADMPGGHNNICPNVQRTKSINIYSQEVIHLIMKTVIE